jgi:hypothetical protein
MELLCILQKLRKWHNTGFDAQSIGHSKSIDVQIKPIVYYT